MKTILQPLNQFDTTMLLRRIKLENPRKELVELDLYCKKTDYKLDGVWYRVYDHSMLTGDIECFKVIRNAE